MKYHIISTSKTGDGAIFTDCKEAKEYQKNYPGSVYKVSDGLPAKIPPVSGSAKQQPVAVPVKATKGFSSGAITVYTDGSALGNPGPGGYGVVIQIAGDTREFSQGYEHTTNNRMEMMAVITALENLKDHADAAITIHSDSQYTINGIIKGWAKGWRKKGWIKSDGKPALNPDFWAIMLDLVDLFSKLNFKWVKGHAGDTLNERADELANGAAAGNGGGGIMMIDGGYLV